MTQPDRRPRRRTLSAGSLAMLAVTLMLAGLGATTFFAERPEQAAQARDWPAFDLQGHRGARGLFPENTQPAFTGALAIGVTTLEMDIGLSADGVLVVSHDRRLSPELTRGPGGDWIAAPGPLIRDLTAAELARYDVGRARPDGKVAQRFPEQQALDGTRVPTLDAVVEAAERQSGGVVRYNIETKIDPRAPDETASPEAFAAALHALIEAHGIADRAAVQSFDWRSLQAMQALAPDIATVYLTAERDWLDNLERGRPGTSPWTAGLDLDADQLSVPQAVARSGGTVWSPYYRDLRRADLREAQGLGLKVVVWTVNDPGDMASLIDLGVDGIITDYPDRLRAVMAAKGLKLPPAFPAPDRESPS